MVVILALLFSSGVHGEEHTMEQLLVAGKEKK